MAKARGTLVSEEMERFEINGDRFLAVPFQQV